MNTHTFSTAFGRLLTDLAEVMADRTGCQVRAQTRPLDDGIEAFFEAHLKLSAGLPLVASAAKLEELSDPDSEAIRDFVLGPVKAFADRLDAAHRAAAKAWQEELERK